MAPADKLDQEEVLQSKLEEKEQEIDHDLVSENKPEFLSLAKSADKQKLGLEPFTRLQS